MSAHTLRLIAFLLYAFCVLPTSAAAATLCDFTRRESLPYLDAGQFFALPLGSFAIGEDCRRAGGNLCARYLPLTGCDEARYATAPSDSKRPISISFNTALGCGPRESCPTISTFIEIGLALADNTVQAQSIDLFRNESWSGWVGRDFRRGFKIRCCNGPLTGDTVAHFLDYHASGQAKAQIDFEREVVEYWHSSFFDRSIQASRTTWEKRELFGKIVRNEICREAGCSLKAYLVKFEETPSGIPTNAVRISGNTRDFRTVVMESFAPLTDGLYTRHVVIHLDHGDD